MDTLTQFKEAQRRGWMHFAPLESQTTTAAADLVRHARIQPGARVLDVACGTGVVAITAARLGATVMALDLTPALLERARENGRIAGVAVDWHEGDVEALPFESAEFDVVTSQFGHIFAPRPDVAIGEMLRVLKPGGTIAFNTWPPELLIGRIFALTARYVPPPPYPATPPAAWGDTAFIRERLGTAVAHIAFDRGRMLVPSLSPQHHRVITERTAGPLIRLVEALTATDEAKLAAFRREYDALVEEYFDRNIVRQDYLITRATKV